MSLRADVPFEVLERINDHPYKVGQLEEYSISATFNVTDSSPSLEDVPLEDLRSNPLQQGEADGDPCTESSTSQAV